jgi:hypothetical protein
MGQRCRRQPARFVWLLVLLLGGCASARDLFALVVPEQTHLDIREPAQIADTPLPALPPPVTVSNPALPPQDLSRRDR